MRDRSKIRPNKNLQEETQQTRLPAREKKAISPPAALHPVDETGISAMAPGDIFLIRELDPGGLTESEPAFHAILACPVCGNQVLLSTAQYFGLAPVICCAPTCPGLFRIIDGERLVYLPLN